MTEPASQRIAELLPRLMGLLHSKVAGDSLAIMHEANLTMPQLVSMHVLRHCGVTTVTDIANATHLSASSASHLIDRLVERGLVARAEDPNDRRQKRIALASDGSALLDRLTAANTRELKEALDTVEPGLQRELVTVLEQVVTQLMTLHARPSGAGIP